MCKENKYINIQTGEELDKVKGLKDNSMLKANPHVWIEWDFEKNNALGLDIYEITKLSTKKAWLICSKCKSSCYSIIKYKVNGAKCLYCLGRKANHTNSLATLRPDLALQWHPTLNGDKSPHNYTCGSREDIWWQCELGHEWINKISERKYGSCPYCSGHRVLKGYNDIHTTSAKLSEILLNYEDGYNLSKGSKVKLDWKCECGQVIKNKSPFIVDKEGLRCPSCSNKGKSYPEKFTYHLLKQLNIEFKWEKTFEWSQNKRYDFYFVYNDEKYIIEVHGAQHYTGGFNHLGGRSLEEEQENDKLKEQLAKENGIKNYIVIDARKSTMKWMVDSVFTSAIHSRIDLSSINFETIDLKSREKLIVELESMWNMNKSIKMISKTTGLDRNSVLRYLKTINNFNPKEDVDYIKKHIDSKIVIEYDYINSTFQELESEECIAGKYTISTLNTLCILKDKYYFKRDYFLSNIDKIKNKIQKLAVDVIYKRKIYQMDYNLNLIGVWDDDNELIAKQFNAHATNLTAHLKGKNLSFSGYLWSYEDELIERSNFFKESFNNKRAYMIYQFDLDGNLISKWRNSSNTEYQNGVAINIKHIKKKVLDKNYYYKGFIFLKSFKYDEIKDKVRFFKEMKSKCSKYLPI